jgi:hypothetical protein
MTVRRSGAVPWCPLALILLPFVGIVALLLPPALFGNGLATRRFVSAYGVVFPTGFWWSTTNAS